jgi:ATP-binding cassette subfamily B protein
MQRPLFAKVAHDRVLPLLRALGITWAIAPRLAAGATALLLLDAVLGIAVLYLLKLLIDGMTGSAGSSTEHGVMWLLALTGGISVLAAIARAVTGLASEQLGQTVSDGIDLRLNREVASADLARLENPEHYDLTSRDLLAGGSRPAQVITNLLQVAQNAVMLAGMAVLLVTIHWILIVLLLVALVPGTLVRLQQSRLLHDWQVRRTRSERHAYYLRWLMTEKSGAKELRVFGLGAYFGARFAALRDQLRSEKFAINRRRMYIELMITLGITIALFSVIAWLASRAVTGVGTYGELVLFLMVFMRGQGAVQALKGSLAALFDDNLYLRALFQFLGHANSVVDPQEPLEVPRRATLEVRNVSFRYPGTAALVLDDVTMTVPEGRIVAVVGANGSGKTTLIKLLCRLYDPSEGEVCWAGADVRCYRQSEYRSRIGVLFQDYVCYETDLTENIRHGNIALDRTSPRILEAARLALVDDYADRLPSAYATMLGRVLEDGHELSLGQWQRLALARALVSDSDLLILDEPTSAMDPDAEARLFGNFREMLGGRSALVISHRLSIVRGADYIYVMRDGRIVEEGTHDELMARRGGYHDLFMAQAQAYRVERPA